MLEAGIAVHDQQQRRREASLLQIRDRRAPRGARFRRGHAQGEQGFLAGFGHPQGGQDRHRDDPARHAQLQMKAIEKHDRVALG